MKYLMFFLLACVACGQSAIVLSSDGGKQVAFCSESLWVKCISDTCPNGYDIVKNNCAIFCSDSIVKCH